MPDQSRTIQEITKIRFSIISLHTPSSSGRGHRFAPPTHSPSPLFTTIQRPLCHSARSCFLSSVRWRRQPPAEPLRKSPPSRNRSSLRGETRHQSPRWWRRGEGGPEEEQTDQGEGSGGRTRQKTLAALTLQLLICRQMPSAFCRISSTSSFMESSLMCCNTHGLVNNLRCAQAGQQPQVCTDPPSPLRVMLTFRISLKP